MTRENAFLIIHNLYATKKTLVENGDLEAEFYSDEIEALKMAAQYLRPHVKRNVGKSPTLAAQYGKSK